MGNSGLRAKKKALIIGNNSYKVDSLQCCLDDAQDITKKLRGIDFDVKLGCNLTYEQMSMMIEKFTNSVTQDDLVVFFFSGHGHELQEENYLIAIDNQIICDQPDLCKKHATCAQTILDDMVAKKPFAVILLLDCCRLPLQVSTGEGLKENQDLNRINPRQIHANSLIVFACGPNQATLDKAPNHRNSLFTYHLLQHIALPNLSVREILVDVFAGVWKDSTNTMRVDQSGGLPTSDVYLNCVGDSPTPATDTSMYRKTARNLAVGIV